MVLEEIQLALSDLGRHYQDTRIHYYQLEAADLKRDRCVLAGAVLDVDTLTAVTTELQSRFPGITFDVGTVEVLRRTLPDFVTICTNVTGLYAAPSFLAEMTAQVLNGWQAEVLRQQDRWSFIRLVDGYLGWVYRPYTSQAPAQKATHIICAPVSMLHSVPAAEAELASRVPGGTEVQVTDVDGVWVQLALAGGLVGWAPAVDARPLDALPQDNEARRQQMVQDAAGFIGVPYLWGGGTALGIDCSGFVQLVHRLAGISIPRDADMQFKAGQPVEPPFEPGDLLFFGGEGDHRAISHVGMSLGGWHIIHSSRSRNGVYVDNVQTADWLRQIFVGARTFV